VQLFNLKGIAYTLFTFSYCSLLATGSEGDEWVQKLKQETNLDILSKSKAELILLAFFVQEARYQQLLELEVEDNRVAIFSSGNISDDGNLGYNSSGGNNLNNLGRPLTKS